MGRAGPAPTLTLGTGKSVQEQREPPHPGDIRLITNYGQKELSPM